jgi:hypothetical protein
MEGRNSSWRRSCVSSLAFQALLLFGIQLFPDIFWYIIAALQCAALLYMSNEAS